MGKCIFVIGGGGYLVVGVVGVDFVFLEWCVGFQLVYQEFGSFESLFVMVGGGGDYYDWLIYGQQVVVMYDVLIVKIKVFCRVFVKGLQCFLGYCWVMFKFQCDQLVVFVVYQFGKGYDRV